MLPRQAVLDVVPVYCIVDHKPGVTCHMTCELAIGMLLKFSLNFLDFSISNCIAMLPSGADEVGMLHDG